MIEYKVCSDCGITYRTNEVIRSFNKENICQDCWCKKYARAHKNDVDQMEKIMSKSFNEYIEEQP